MAEYRSGLVYETENGRMVSPWEVPLPTSFLNSATAPLFVRTGHNVIVDAVFASGQAYSTEIELDGYRLGGVSIPSGWTSGATTITLQSSLDAGETWQEFSLAGNAATITPIANTYCGLKLQESMDNSTPPMIRFRMGTAVTPISADVDTTMKVVLIGF